MVPVNVMDALPVPVPVTNVKPVVCARVVVPFDTLSVTCIAAVPASASAIEMAFPFATENTSAESSLTVCKPGAELVGPSLIDATLIDRLIDELANTPSLATKVTERAKVFGFSLIFW
jgi:hypothetical protein